jgi:hypothetical protein
MSPVTKQGDGGFYHRTQDTRCEQADCEWWVKSEKSCAVRVIAERKKKIVETTETHLRVG